VDAIEDRYSNLFEMYERITDENPYKVPMRIYPAPHYTMGGLWVDYNLMTNVPGLYSIGEANFSDHGANRLGASALMQGLADGYFVLPYTIGDYLADYLNVDPVATDDPAFAEAEVEVSDRVISGYLSTNGTRTVDWFHKELGKIMLDYCGMSRSEAGLNKALSEIPALYEEFRSDVRVPGRERVAQPEPGASRPGRGLLRTGPGDVHRRPLPRGVLRRPLPRGAPDGGRRGTPRRRELRPCRLELWTGDPPSPNWSRKLEFENVKLTTRSYK
jgi:succinate dehydrogenase/fumarate reductase flavoprotein subunit